MAKATKAVKVAEVKVRIERADAKVAKYTAKLERAKARVTRYTAKITEWMKRRAELGATKLRRAA